MKTTLILFTLVITATIFFSCQKPFTAEQSFTSTGTLTKDTSGNCTPVNVNGIYKAGVLLGTTNYMDVSVSVTATGSYNITSDTLNGIYFSGNGDFIATGTQTIRLTGHGTPVTAGILTFIIHYNNSSSCAVRITVSPSGASTAAVFALTGAPGACTVPVIQGTYTAGTILNPSNKLIVAVSVTSLGDYTLSTAVVNGISFSATGTFTSLNNQTVTLTGSGTPLIAGTNNMLITGTAAGCSFPITVGSTTSSGTYLAAAYFIDTTLTAPLDTIERVTYTYDALNRIISIKTFDIKPNGDSAYYGLQTITYNSTDTMANRKTEYYRDFSSTPPLISTSTNYYSYLNGRVVYDSIPSNTGYYTQKYVYNGNTVLRTNVSISASLPMPYYDTATIRQTIINGNNTYQLDTLVGRFANANPISWHYQRMEITTSYLQNPNPLYQIGKAFLRPYYYDDIGIGSEATPPKLIAQQNSNFLSWGNGVSGLNTDQVNYTYTFRPDGYPIEARQTFINNGTVTKHKLIFVYR